MSKKDETKARIVKLAAEINAAFREIAIHGSYDRYVEQRDRIFRRYGADPKAQSSGGDIQHVEGDWFIQFVSNGYWRAVHSPSRLFKIKKLPVSATELELIEAEDGQPANMIPLDENSVGDVFNELVLTRDELCDPVLLEAALNRVAR